MDVTLRDAGDGTIAVAIELDGGLDGAGIVLFGIDTDRNPRTGDEGDDYLVVVTARGAGLGRWDGSRWSAFPHRALWPTLDGDHLGFSLAVTDLGTRTFDYWAAAVHENEVEAIPAQGRFTFP